MLFRLGYCAYFVVLYLFESSFPRLLMLCVLFVSVSVGLARDSGFFWLVVRVFSVCCVECVFDLLFCIVFSTFCMRVVVPGHFLYVCVLC